MIAAEPPFWLALLAIALVVYASGCAHAPKRERCLWLSSAAMFECLSKSGDFYSLKPNEAKNLVCYEPAEDAEFMKYCRGK